MTIRFSGLMSGMDTDNMIQQLMRVHQIKVDRVEQDKQYAEWQRDAFRDVSNQVRGFRDNFFDFLNSDNNMRSPRTFNSMRVEYNGLESSPFLSVSPGSNAVQGNYEITDIELAREAELEGVRVTADMLGNELDLTDGNITINDDNNQFSVNLNGVSRVITLFEGKESDSVTAEALRDEIAEQIDATFGEGRIVLALDGDRIKITDPIGSSNINLNSVSGNSGLETIGFADGANSSNRISLRSNIADITGYFAGGIDIAEGKDISFTINGVDFEFDSSKTSLNDIMNEVNNSDAGVTMRYDELNDNFRFISDEMGQSAQINIDGDFLTDSLNMNNISASGEDASLKINGQTVSRSSNNFIINGTTFNLNQATEETINLSIDTNPDQTAEKIINFVEEYNELIGELNTKLSEPQNRDYRPLTDDQRHAMSDREIEMWEEQAQSGLLRRDPLLQRMVTQMRTALFETVEGAGMSLHEMGISTSRNYLDGGRLQIDEDRLKAAIAENPEGVTALFTQQSDKGEEKGLSHRLYDIVQANIRTTRDNNGRKGLLLEKAGIEGDTSEINNSINREIIGYDNRINSLLDTISRQEEYYYRMFTRMESALSEMYAQSDWLTAQLGGGMM
ncbi:flagellar filament capping protein FliD [Natronospora cellulosivora (SeqCode)]